ncbi:MAG: hydrogenase nickel incorporation protein HypB [Mobilicoccus sp.]|nr:hydrogenase nickel incorporation protein HypB [Mobilicoccus sp.]
MGRFHRHDDGHEHDHHHGDHANEHSHHHDEHGHSHDQHGDHSKYETGPERVMVLERIFDENDAAAQRNRDRLEASGVRCLNVMSSPGAGKTELLRATLQHLQGRVAAGVVEGDIETSIDADRLAGFGAQVSLVNTGDGFGGECHLDAPMVAKGLDGLDLDALDVLFVENVGNLVCPAEFDVGAHRRIMVYSLTEGEEKPLKYPVMFRAVDLVVVTKTDLLPHLDADLATFEANLRRVNPGVDVVKVSVRTGEGLPQWFDWLEADLAG